MQIKVPEKFTPFTHLPGQRFLLASTLLAVEIYPCLIRVYDYSLPETPLIQEIELPFEGPLTGPKGEFTAMVEIEKSSIKVWGDSPKGFIRYMIQASSHPKEIELLFEKKPGMQAPAKGFERVPLPQKKQEKLFLGCHKKGEWDQVSKRAHMDEILPYWLCLSQAIHLPKLEPDSSLGDSLLTVLEKNISEKKHEHIYEPLMHLFKAGFHYVLTPRLLDTDYQGFHLPVTSFPLDISPCHLITESAKCIQKIFYQYDSDSLDLLPVLPPEFPHGRYINIQCGELGVLDLEWTKKVARRAIFRSEKDQQLQFIFHRGIREYRLRKNLKDNGTVCANKDKIVLEEGNTYYFDNLR